MEPSEEEVSLDHSVSVSDDEELRLIMTRAIEDS